jgi:hypothetical protein
LPLEEALPVYLHEKKHSPHRWMLGRFVCPAARLHDLLTLAQQHPDRSLLSLTVLGQQSSDFASFQANVNADCLAIQQIREAYGSHGVIDVLEAPFPNVDDVKSLGAMVKHAADACLQGGVRGFLEPALSPRWHDDVKSIAQAVQGNSTLGLKLRCGGVAAAAFPNSVHVASFIVQCRAARCPWKATAGLHHPRRHWDAALQLWHHGFLNVFGAAVIAWTHALTEADLIEILSDREGRHFRFNEGAFAWKQWSCTTEQIADARAQFAISFGSCSFEEPCADLSAMGLLD